MRLEIDLEDFGFKLMCPTCGQQIHIDQDDIFFKVTVDAGGLHIRGYCSAVEGCGIGFEYNIETKILIDEK